jgi:hypothetical protein
MLSIVSCCTVLITKSSIFEVRIIFHLNIFERFKCSHFFLNCKQTELTCIEKEKKPAHIKMECFEKNCTLKILLHLFLKFSVSSYVILASIICFYFKLNLQWTLLPKDA